MRFTANAAGTITELRYFRGAADASDTDTRVLNLWNAAGVLLGSVTVTSTAGESGWQVGTLSTPIAIEAGATYVVSYGTTQNYAVTANYFTTAHSGPDGVLTAGVSSGVFADGTPGVFPTVSYNASNYWADVTFIPNSAPIITSGADLTSPENRSLAATITATDANASPLTYAIAGGADAALFTIDAQTGAAALRQQPELRGPGRRRRQQRLRPDRQRQRRHRAGGDQGRSPSPSPTGTRTAPARTSSARPTRRRRPRQPTRPTTSSA